ncbi:MAG: hypothetical protein KC415_23580 [Anaerolineales bacterium]|nr:hypothetical protein [Anaerolineales bacterium]
MSNKNLSPPTLVATLGLQPQIITRALDELLKLDTELREVYIIHTGAFPKRHPHWSSLEKFKAYLDQNYHLLSFYFEPIQDEDGRILLDVESPETAELAFKIIFNVIKDLKHQGRRLHGLIAGGRKSMIVYTMISAQLLFDEDDPLWHLFSTFETQDPHVDEGKDRSHLAEIPILHLAGLMPMVRELILNSDDPTRAFRLYHKHERIEEIARLQRFYQEQCDELDREILCYAFKGWGNREISRRINMSESAISNRITDIADRFFKPGVGGVLRPRPTRIRLPLLRGMEPLLSQTCKE